MPKVTYTREQKAEAVALAVIVGADAAAEQLGYPDGRAIRRWLAAAGKAPADAISSVDWAALGDLARAQVATALTTGKVRTKDAAVIAAIAARNVAREPKPEPESRTPEQQWFDGLTSDERADLSDYLRILLRSDPELWHDDPIAYLSSIPDPVAWLEATRAADHEAMERQLEENERRKAEFLASQPSPPGYVDPETERLIKLAEAWLGEGVNDAA